MGESKTNAAGVETEDFVLFLVVEEKEEVVEEVVGKTE